MASLTVGISDLKVALPPDILATYALGSCVGICLLDATSRVGGLAHIMLPSKAVSPSDKNIAKFADSAIPELVRQMEQKGAVRARIRAKIAGGAQMFAGGGQAASSDLWQIGQRNVNATTAVLRELSIPIIAKDVLADYGRTVFFDPATGVMTVKAINRGIREL